ncbi:MAG: DUF4339 domain-containing protein [Deltaproteobacteria bacterium]|nr:DUF4339 domain-containing protein [Deltaproteobacteria bacterium]
MIPMSETAQESKQYFLGVNGEQSGPHSEHEVLSKIRTREITSESYVWYEGLEDWQPIAELYPFADAFKNLDKPALVQNQTNAPSSEPIPDNRSSTTPNVTLVDSSVQADCDDSKLVSTFATDAQSMAPVFEGNEAVFSYANSVRNKLFIFLGGGGLILALLAGGFYFFASSSPTETAIDPHPPKTKGPSAESLREIQFRKALSELTIKPTESLQVLLGVFETNPNDPIGKQALDAMVSFYRQVRKPSEAGRLLMKAGQPEEAVKLFMVDDPPAFQEAEAAYFASYQKASEPGAKQQYLAESVRLLLQPLVNERLAMERIEQLQKEFPHIPHPYQYYLKSEPEKIQDLFSRFSFFFVQSLISHLESEFPHLNLKRRPAVEVKRSKQGRYRIEGSYKGEVSLKQDKLNNILLVFWYVDDQWHLVDTNLTVERQKWSKKERDNLAESQFSEKGMLKYLEQLFRTQFPSTPLHERVSVTSLKPKEID